MRNEAIFKDALLISIVGANPCVRPRWINMGRHAGLPLQPQFRKKIKNRKRSHFNIDIRKLCLIATKN